MRPLSDVAKAILKTACELSAAGRRVTLAEMAAGACVGQKAATYTVKNLRRSGHLKIVGLRRVAYRNRPVSEYAPAALVLDAASSTPMADLSRCISSWTR